MASSEPRPVQPCETALEDTSPENMPAADEPNETMLEGRFARGSESNVSAQNCHQSGKSSLADSQTRCSETCKAVCNGAGCISEP
jgi:hypothetical protein